MLVAGIPAQEGLALLWLALSITLYCAVHSILASLAVKTWVMQCWPGAMPGYRLAYNLMALGLLMSILWQLSQYPGEQLWQWPGILEWLMSGLGLAALGGFIWSLKSYDLQAFIGLRQWREGSRATGEQEAFQLSPLHRYVRHPWYFFILVMLWTREMNVAQLLTYGLISVYLLLGSRLEERKLITYYGEAYQRYRERVPGLFPWPGRRLSREEAQRLEQQSRH